MIYAQGCSEIRCDYVEPSSRILKGEEVGKTKVKGGAGYEASTCLVARDVSQKHQFQIHLPLER